jgi:hypothetical protein
MCCAGIGHAAEEVRRLGSDRPSRKAARHPVWERADAEERRSKFASLQSPGFACRGDSCRVSARRFLLLLFSPGDFPLSSTSRSERPCNDQPGGQRLVSCWRYSTDIRPRRVRVVDLDKLNPDRLPDLGSFHRNRLSLRA